MNIQDLRSRLLQGMVIPAHPLALSATRKLDERRQRALTRYYLAAGAGGLAVGVHTTQFAIRDVGLYAPVLTLAAETAKESTSAPILIAGVCGGTAQAVREAETARSLGYDCALLSLAALQKASDEELIHHCSAVAQVLPLFGFYLQPAVGGRVLTLEFWQAFAQLENAVAIKIAPFNRYQTLDVMRAVAESGRLGEIALYTGNDDNIVVDLLSEYEFSGRAVRTSGGLLGQWAVGTRAAVRMLNDLRGRSVAEWRIGDTLRLANALTDTNAALFDTRNNFHGCIPGIHEVLRRQGLLVGRWCLDPAEELSPGQMEEIDRVLAAYPHLHDDAFIGENIDSWMS
jgi:dihydrodipicolinate synthase/N-acetylneuraminate lyase